MRLNISNATKVFNKEIVYNLNLLKNTSFGGRNTDFFSDTMVTLDILLIEWQQNLPQSAKNIVLHDLQSIKTRGAQASLGYARQMPLL